MDIQQIRPQWARLCLRVEGFVRRELGLDLHGRRILFALSGGADSTALLCIFCLLQRKAGFYMRAAHLHHMLRPEADQEARFVSRLCRETGVDCSLGESRVDIYARRMQMGREQAGRVIRYRFLHGLADRQDCDYIFVGHHLNDLAEDMLMRQVRGAGWPGLAGMPGINGKVVRPLLLTPGASLRALLEELGQGWMEDASNQDRSYMRNRVRRDILPLFFKENPGFLDQVVSLWRQGNMDRDFFQNRLARLPRRDESGEVILRGEDLNSLHPALRCRAYKMALEELGPGQVLFENILALDRAWAFGRGGKCVQFPGEKTARVKGRNIIFSPGKKE
ncbi:MAG: tRNA lysidine(34) synthetase TilS [Desulfonatronovibrionaceae bacterium]